MKKIIATLVLAFAITLTIFSQSVNGVPLDKLDSEFVIITKHVSNSEGIVIGQITLGSVAAGTLLVEFGNGDYVTNLRRKKDKEAELRDANGEEFSFKNAAQAISFFDRNGYDLIDYNITPFGVDSLMNTYMMARRKEVKEE